MGTQVLKMILIKSIIYRLESTAWKGTHYLLQNMTTLKIVVNGTFFYQHDLNYLKMAKNNFVLEFQLFH